MALSVHQRVLTVLIAGLAMWGTVALVAGRYEVAFDHQSDRCLPWKVFLIDRSDRTPRRFALMAFRSRGIRFFKDGLLFTKYVAGVPGDVMDVRVDATRVAGISWGPINTDYAKTLNKTAAAFTRAVPISAGHVAMLTGSPHSYDSRYWGLVDQAQLVGRAVPLW